MIQMCISNIDVRFYFLVVNISNVLVEITFVPCYMITMGTLKSLGAMCNFFMFIMSVTISCGKITYVTFEWFYHQMYAIDMLQHFFLVSKTFPTCWTYML